MMPLSVIKLLLVVLDPVPDCHTQGRRNGCLSFTSHVDEERRKLCRNISVNGSAKDSVGTYHAAAAQAGPGLTNNAS